MKTKSFTLEVLVLFLLSLIPWPGPTVFKISCSRDNAKIVRKIVQSKWIPVLEKHQVKLPLECPFHPLRDIFGPQHAAKFQHRSSQWTCGFCGKSFYEEKYLDMHFDNRHKSKINKAEDAVCLADYCDIMRCQVLISQDATLGTEGNLLPSTDIEIWQEATVYRTALATSGPREVARIFLKSNEQQSSKLKPRPKMEEHRNCPRTSEPKPDDDLESVEDESDGKTNDNDGDQNSTSELCDKDMVDSALPPVDQKQQRISELQKLKANCNPEDLQKLKVRCELLVRDCIAGLIIHLSVHDFKEIEEEMNRAVCWYLSCDRYWEDAATTVRPFPWPLVIGITTVLTLGICMCYYIIWVLFDSDDKSLESNSASATAHSSPTRGAGGPGGPMYSEEYYTVADLNDLGQNEHYIYVTYPPELKRRLLERIYVFFWFVSSGVLCRVTTFLALEIYKHPININRDDGLKLKTSWYPAFQSQSRRSSRRDSDRTIN